MNNEEQTTEPVKENKINKTILILVIIVLGLSSIGIFLMTTKDNPEPKKKTKVELKEYKSDYKLTGNGLEDFDLHFLQLDNQEKNKIYSPLSIKYALEMLAEGTDGNSKGQLDALIGDYTSNKYTNSKNLSLANAFFIRDTIKKDIKKDYINLLKDKYNAEVKFDSFKKPDNVNNWVKNKTLNLIPKVLNDVSNYDFLLINALAIDMDWIKEIQSKTKSYYVPLKHEEVQIGDGEYKTSSISVDSLMDGGYSSLSFNNSKKESKAVEIAAVANKYDIVKTLGEDKIKNEITNKYTEWLNTEDGEYCSTKQSNRYPSDANTYVEQYMKDINSNYNHLSSSTDFSFYDDEEVKVFAKDFKEYDNNQLEYIAIMPKEEELTDFIANTNSTKINEIISKLKDISSDSFEDGYLTVIDGYIPLFKYDYELKLIDNLKKLGVVDIFDPELADLSKMITKQSYINLVLHKANIEFSNKGVKAAAVTVIGGMETSAIDDGRNCYFDYKYEVPVKYIDLTFDKPFIYIIRDKNSKEVWFTGTVYKPSEYSWND